MTNVYSVKIDKNPPFRVQFINETNDEIDTYAINKFDFNNLCQNNYYTDTNHDNTTNEPGIPSEDKAINLAYSFYPDRFNELKFMLVKKDQYKKIHAGDYTVEVTHVDTKNSLEPTMPFIDFVKNVLKIDFDETQIPRTPDGHIILETCENPPNDIPIKSFYTFLKFYDIRDMNRSFDGRNAVSFHIDSATSPDTLKLVPNICKKFYNGKFNLHGFKLPGTLEFNDENNTNFSFLYFGDLMIVNHYFHDLQLGGLQNGFDAFTFANDFFFFDEAGTPAAKIVSHNTGITPPNLVLFTSLCKYTLISLNIFWQTLLSYIHVYMKLQIGDESNNVIEALRHWIFCGINYNDTKPSFNGKFVKTIVYDPTDVTYIAYWFLHTHHHKLPLPIGPGGAGATPFVCTLMKQNSSTQEFSVIQSDCANFVNEVYEFCNEDPIAIPRPGFFRKAQLFKAIAEAFTPYNNKNINDPLNKLIVRILQILKYSGDMSHKVAVMIYKIVFSGRSSFKNFTPGVTTTDRPLIKDFFIDNIPGIIVSANAAILQLCGITNLFGHTINSLRASDDILLSFYLPILQTDIFSLLLKYINKLNDYILLLSKIYDPNSSFFKREQKFRDKRDSDTKIIVNIVYQYLTYITMLYLSLFSSEIYTPAGAIELIEVTTPGGATGANTNEIVDPFAAPYQTRHLATNRVNYAWFAYYYYKHPFNKIKMDNLHNSKFVGVDSIDATHTVIQSFLKNQMPTFILDTTNAPDSVKTLNNILIAHNYPLCFEIKTKFYQAGTPDPAAPPPAPPAVAPFPPPAAPTKEQSLKDYLSSLFSLYKDIVKNRDNHDINYTAEIEKDFFEKLELRTELGGTLLRVAPEPVLPAILPTNHEVDQFYKKYLLFDSGYPYDDSLLKLSNMFDNYVKITDTINETKYEELFKALDPLNQLLPDVNDFDSNFVYTYQYKDKNELTSLNDSLTPADAKRYFSLFNLMQNVKGNKEDAFFNVKPMVITEVNPPDNYDVTGFYLFPFLRLSDFFKKIGGVTIKVGKPFIVNKNLLNYTYPQNEADMLIDILSNFLNYIRNLNDFLDLYEKQIGFYKFAKNETVLSIFQGVQCRFIIYFSLLMFNFTCKFEQILQIQSLFHTDLQMVDRPLVSTQVSGAGIPPGIEEIRNTNPRAYKRTNPPDSDLLFYLPTNVLTDLTIANQHLVGTNDINCIGLFTLDHLHSNHLSQFNFTKIKGLYFIGNKRIKLVYDDLQNQLSDFFMKYETHFGDGFYGDIKFL